MHTSKAEIQSVMAVAKAAFLAEHKKEGEEYAGLLLGQNGEPDEHIFLLPDELENATWDKSVAWAKSKGGRLPRRREQHLLIANLKSEFKSAYYWSGEQHAGYPSNAWDQTFSDGYQHYSLKSAELRARAVRSVVI